MDREYLKERIITAPGVSEAAYKKDEKFFTKVFNIVEKQNRFTLLDEIIGVWKGELQRRRDSDEKDSIFNPLAYLTTMIKEKIDLDISTQLVTIEGNLIDLPYYRQGKRTSEPIVFEYTRKGDNSKITTVWRIETATLIPNQEDADVLRGLIKIWIDSGKPENGVIYFTIYRLCKILKLPTDGRTYSKIMNAIDYFKKATITSIDAFLDFKNNRYVNTQNEKEALSIIDYYRFRDPGKLIPGQDELFQSEVRLSKELVDNMLLYYSTRIDWEFITSLRFGISKRIYEILQKRRGKDKKRAWATKLLPFAQRCCMNIKTPRNVKQNMQNALNELLERKYILGFEIFKKEKVEYIRFDINNDYA